jgi:transposase
MTMTNAKHQPVCSRTGTPKGYSSELLRQREDVAALDIGSEIHYASVPEERDAQHVRNFGCTTPDLARLSAWLRECAISEVVMESTGVYWVPVFEFLQDQGFHVCLVDGRAVKNVPGRKSDFADSQWIRIVHSYGLVRPCFLPDRELSTVRSFWRQRSSHVQSCAQQIHLMHKALEQMNVQLHKVLSDVTGVAGMAVLRAIVRGEHDPEQLASLVTTRVKHGRDKFIAALTGHYRHEHVFALTQALQTFDFYQQQIKACDAEVAACLSAMAPQKPTDDQNGSEHWDGPDTPISPKGARRRKNQPYFDLKSELIRIVGSDVTVLSGIDSMTAQTVFSECGYQLAAFPSEGHFSSYLGFCSANNKTGGKVRSSRTRRVTNRAAIAFRVAAQSLHRSQTAIGAFSRRMRARLVLNSISQRYYVIITHVSNSNAYRPRTGGPLRIRALGAIFNH